MKRLHLKNKNQPTKETKRVLVTETALKTNTVLFKMF
jgi:hypothetical protein